MYLIKSPTALNGKSGKKNIPNICATVPSDYDATVVYEQEPWQMMSGYLMEKAGLRRDAVNAAFIALQIGDRSIDDSVKQKAALMDAALDFADSTKSAKPPFAGTILMAGCREKKDLPLLYKMLDSDRGWLKIHAAKTLMIMDAKEAAPVIMEKLAAAKDDADYGYDMDYSRFQKNNFLNPYMYRKKKYGKEFPEKFQHLFTSQKKKGGLGYDEYNDPSPRFKEAYIMALGNLGAKQADELLIQFLNNDRNVIEIQYAAANALIKLGTPKALEALRVADAEHPVASVKQIAREAVWIHKLEKLEQKSYPKTTKLSSCLFQKVIRKRLHLSKVRQMLETMNRYRVIYPGTVRAMVVRHIAWDTIFINSKQVILKERLRS